MPNSKQIVYLSQAQYAELIANGTITVDGVTVTYDENDIYVTPQAEPVTDVKVAGTSVAANGVANIPIATTSILGVVKGYGSGGIRVFEDGRLAINSADESAIKGAGSSNLPIVPSRQHISVFYGLARAAGATMNALPNTTVGVYPAAQKAAIQSMLGVSGLIATAEPTLVASKAYAVGDVFTANGKLYKATAAIAANDSIITQDEGETISGANAVECKVSEGFVKFTDIATNNDFGIVKVSASNYGLKYLDNNPGIIVIRAASDNNIKNSYSAYAPIVAGTQDKSVFYGLAKAAGADEKDSTLPVGQYTDTAKAAIRSMIGATSPNVIAVQDIQPTDTDTKIWLPETAETPVEVPTVEEMEQALAGKVGDVQVNGTSVVTDGVANIPMAGLNTFGVIKVRNGDNGLGFSQNYLCVYSAQISDIKSGNHITRPIVPYYQHQSVFYGLAKAAGDTTQSSSSNAVGTYTDNAKASIKQMLGIVDGSTGTVDVTGTTPTITAVENTRYVCGEVTSLNFTPAASGICIVRFTSGSTVTVLTIPSTVKFPEWFDPTSLETNTIYEICVTDGVYGAVMSWAQ